MRAMAKKLPQTPKVKPGHKPDILKIEGNWEDAVAKSLKKKKPATGWPKK